MVRHPEPWARRAWREITAAEAGVAEQAAPRRDPPPAPPAGSAVDPLTLLVGAPPDARERLSRLDLTLAGTGAVGAAFVELLPAFGLGTVRLVDPDTYSPSNLRSQPIAPDALGRPKCEVVGRRLKARSPETRVLVLHDRFERLCAADLAFSHAIALAGDNLMLTVAASQRACQLGQAIIEGATHGPTLVAQVRSTAPAEKRERACPCCTWDQAEERELARQTRFACDGSGRTLANPAGPSGALSALSAQAASLMAFELLRRVLRLDDSDVIVESWVFRRATVVSPLVANPDCRVEHAPWNRATACRSLGKLSPAEIFRLAQARDESRRAVRSLEIEGAQWISRGSCACPGGSPVNRFAGRGGADLGRCTRCGCALRPDPLRSHVEVPGTDLSGSSDRPLRELGAPDARAAIVRGARSTYLVTSRAEEP